MRDLSKKNKHKEENKFKKERETLNRIKEDRKSLEEWKNCGEEMKNGRRRERMNWK